MVTYQGDYNFFLNDWSETQNLLIHVRQCNRKEGKDMKVPWWDNYYHG